MNKSFFEILWRKTKFNDATFYVAAFFALTIFVSISGDMTFSINDDTQIVITHRHGGKRTTVEYYNNKIDLSKEDEGIEARGIDEPSREFLSSKAIIPAVFFLCSCALWILSICGLIYSLLQRYKLGCNVYPEYISIPKERLMAQIESEIKKGKVVYADCDYKEGARVSLKALAESNVVVLKDYLLVINGSNYGCKVFPNNEIAWIGPQVSTEVTENIKEYNRIRMNGVVITHTFINNAGISGRGSGSKRNREVYKLVIYTRDDVLSLEMDEDKILLVANKLLEILIKNLEKSRLYLKNSLGETTDDFELSKKMETLFYSNTQEYKDVINNLLSINKKIEANETDEVNYTSV